MIEIKNISKSFDNLLALDNVTATIAEGHVFGLIGTNGAGKSTLLRSICGILRPDRGSILIDGEEVYENLNAKSKIFYISDDQYFFPNGTPMDMAGYYASLYPNFDGERFLKLLEVLQLDKGRRINTFSKGMRKQLSVLLGVCAGTKYLLCDETFDGLDPVIRQAVKSLFIKEIEEHGMTPIIASHNLRELEDICEHVGLLHKGGILFTQDLEDMKLGIFKLQCVFRDDASLEALRKQFTLLKEERRGSLYTMTMKGSSEELDSYMASLKPVFYERLPLSLEEIFISETEVMGYDFANLYA